MTTRPKRRSGNPARLTLPLTAYWHGGASGLQPGDLLRSPSARGGPGRGDYSLPDTPYDASRVYVTRDRNLARQYAADHLNTGTLYNVQPVGDLEPDPDYPFDPDFSFTCQEAVVVRVVEARVRMSEVERAKVGARYAKWEDGSPMYDEDGYFTLHEKSQALGITVEILRSLGPWRIFKYANDELHEAISTGRIQTAPGTPLNPLTEAE